MPYRVQWVFLRFLAALFVLSAMSEGASASDVRYGPVPRWVQGVEVDLDADSLQAQARDGVHYLLAEMQTRIEPRDKVLYSRVVSKAVGQGGPELMGKVDVEFDPSYQTLTLHALNLYRDGRVQSRLRSAAPRVLQREKGLESSIFDGHQQLVMIVEDLRVGDVLEFAYSLRGVNPVFRNRHSGRLDLQWGVPVQRVYRRLLAPLDRPIHLARHDRVAAPVVTEQDGQRDHVWDIGPVAALEFDSDTPRWHDDSMNVEWSEFDGWASVAAWAEPMYRPAVAAAGASAPNGPAAQVARIAAASASSEERAMGVLRFVQGEVRYLGIEIGAGSHEPNPPGLVMARRYGDCKDKSLLAATMLQALGMDAHVALVNTRERHGIFNRLPMPGVFNHAIVHLRLGSRSYWLDPTRNVQHGTLDTVHQPDFGFALVLDGRAQHLTSMVGASNLTSLREISITVDMRGSLSEPVLRTVKTTLRGDAAEGLRASLERDGQDGLQRQYLNWYAERQPGTTSSTPMQIVRRDSDNEVETTEVYAVSGLWKRNDKAWRHEAYVAVPEVTQLLRGPRQTIRSAPLGVAYPFESSVKVEMLFSTPWPDALPTVIIDGPSFRFRRSASIEDHRLVVHYRFTRTSDHVMPGDMPEYVRKLDEARGKVGQAINHYDEGLWPALVRKPTIAVLPCALFVSIAGAAVLAYRRPRPAPSAPAPGEAGSVEQPWQARAAHGIVWRRMQASVIDSVALVLVLLALKAALVAAGLTGAPSVAAWWLYGVLPAVLMIGFWKRWGATPGMLVLRLRLANADTGSAPSLGQLLVRYAGLIVAAVPIGLGLVWIVFNRRRQGWHDMLARTVVLGQRSLPSTRSTITPDCPR